MTVEVVLRDRSASVIVDKHHIQSTGGNHRQSSRRASGIEDGLKFLERDVLMPLHRTILGETHLNPRVPITFAS